MRGSALALLFLLLASTSSILVSSNDVGSAAESEVIGDKMDSTSSNIDADTGTDGKRGHDLLRVFRSKRTATSVIGNSALAVLSLVAFVGNFSFAVYVFWLSK
jgi:hypothetical protein